MHLHQKHKAQHGFTIVELIIVVVIIAILAAITIVAYNGVQNRARDSKRAADMASIQKAIAAYDMMNNGVPSTSSYLSGTDLHSGWDSSSNTTWLSFLRATNGPMPVDSQNTLSANNNPPAAGNTVYYYYCYPAGAGPLPATPNVRIGYHKTDGTAQETSFAVNACT